MFELDLSGILEAPTMMRSEVAEKVSDDFDLSGLQFDEEEEEEEGITDLAAPEPEQFKIKITEAEARDSAEVVVDLIDTFNSVSLTPLARWKLKKKLGGSKVIRAMQAIFEKDIEGKELTPREIQMKRQYVMYLKDKEEAEGLIPFTPEERDKLTRAMTAYFKKKNILFSGDYSFWAEFAMIEGMKIAQILTM